MKLSWKYFFVMIFLKDNISSDFYYYIVNWEWIKINELTACTSLRDSRNKLALVRQDFLPFYFSNRFHTDSIEHITREREKKTITLEWRFLCRKFFFNILCWLLNHINFSLTLWLAHSLTHSPHIVKMWASLHVIIDHKTSFSLLLFTAALLFLDSACYSIFVLKKPWKKCEIATIVNRECIYFIMLLHIMNTCRNFSHDFLIYHHPKKNYLQFFDEK